ncbi:MAG: signal peptidase I [Firmicutes bacterium]|nr:signal peptidase I [Bacillota bacterium]
MKRSDVIRILWRCFLFCLICVILLTYVYAICKVPSGSMEPTIRTRSFILALRLPYIISDPTPQVGDIIVFRSHLPGDERLLLKRVIGLPGDTIEIHDGHVYRNGVVLDEPYLTQEGATYAPWAAYTVPDAKLMVLGDNRGNSRDSRYWRDPYVPVDAVWGRVLSF